MAQDSEDLAQLGERHALKSLVWPTIAATQGRFVGEDTAVLEWTHEQYLLITIDAGPRRTFLSMLGVGSTRDLGHYAATMSLSDVAAMGGTPKYLVVGILAPKDLPGSDLQGIVIGIHDACLDVGASYVGGDTKEGDTLRLITTVVGEVERARILLRSTANAGDLLFVSERLGATLASYLDAYDSPPQPVARPAAKIAFARRISHFATACLDLSDGPIAGATQLAEMSRVDVHLDASRLLTTAHVPRTGRSQHWDRLLLSTGSDFALMFTAPAEYQKELEHLGAVACGYCSGGTGIVEVAGAPEGIAAWEHFRSATTLAADLEALTG